MAEQRCVLLSEVQVLTESRHTCIYLQAAAASRSPETCIFSSGIANPKRALSFPTAVSGEAGLAQLQVCSMSLLFSSPPLLSNCTRRREASFLLRLALTSHVGHAVRSSQTRPGQHVAVPSHPSIPFTLPQSRSFTTESRRPKLKFSRGAEFKSIRSTSLVSPSRAWRMHVLLPWSHPTAPVEP